MKKILFTLLLTAGATAASAQNAAGGISPQMLQDIRKTQPEAGVTKILRNALFESGMRKLVRPAVNTQDTDTAFSHIVHSKGVTDQKSSGRCWLFTGMNVMRAKMIKQYNLGEFQFSQAYSFFYDQLEKSNLFLQAVIDKAGLPMDDMTNDWLFKHPLSDGGTFCGVQDVVMKYGIVPAEVMPESYAANNTSEMSSIITLKLREYGLALRKMAEKGAKSKELEKKKTEMLATIYHILSMCIGEPPTQFEWAMTDANGKKGEKRTYTPLSFYKEYIGKDLKKEYVMLMNDPSRPFHKTYTIDLDRHSYDGEQWTFINLPMDEIKQMAIASIKDSVMMYYSCDVGKFLNSSTGILSLDNYDYSALFSTEFPMNKADRIRTFASASSHAMTLMGVDLDEKGKPRKWMVENSWGPKHGHKGHLIMTDEWFDEYSFRLVVERRFVPEATLRLLKQKPVVLPAWDPLFAPEQ